MLSRDKCVCHDILSTADVKRLMAQIFTLFPNYQPSEKKIIHVTPQFGAVLGMFQHSERSLKLILGSLILAHQTGLPNNIVMLFPSKGRRLCICVCEGERRQIIPIYTTETPTAQVNHGSLI